jgi:hypothetical protein
MSRTREDKLSSSQEHPRLTWQESGGEEEEREERRSDQT